jgi:hypothetical protein
MPTRNSHERRKTKERKKKKEILEKKAGKKGGRWERKGKGTSSLHLAFSWVQL